ncbi:MAG: hypothetical protein ACTHNK_00395 [Thermomicrobiales bacterium]
MSTFAATPRAVHRPATVTAAAVLLALLALSALFTVSGAIPRLVLLVSFGFAALKLVAAVGLWRCQRWAAILGCAVTLLDALAAAPGLVAAPAAPARVFVIIGISLNVAALVLLVLPAARHAYA